MTEDEAKTKWCSAARVNAAANVDGFDYVSNRPQHDPHNCIGSACMAWRWRGWFLDDDRNCHAAEPPTDPSVRLGYCGLAGAPQ